MMESNRPGARWQSARAGDNVLGGKSPHTIATVGPQSHRRNPPPRLMTWRVDRWLTVSGCAMANFAVLVRVLPDDRPFAVRGVHARHVLASAVEIVSRPDAAGLVEGQRE